MKEFYEHLMNFLEYALIWSVCCLVFYSIVSIAGCTTTLVEWECYDEAEIKKRVAEICEACDK